MMEVRSVVDLVSSVDDGDRICAVDNRFLMRTGIWLSFAGKAWLELAKDDNGTISISRIADRTCLRPNSLTVGRVGIFEGITIEDIRSALGSTSGSAEESALSVDGDESPPGPAEEPPVKKSKSLREAGLHWQQFVRSAGQNFLAYEKAVSGGSQEKFLAVSGDPLGDSQTPGKGYLIWIRKCYEDLMGILKKANVRERFILRGTAGIGKTMFTLVWISYLATQRKKVVFKSASTYYYLLDFTLTEAKVFGPFNHMGDSLLQDVLDDSTAWLILDGGQEAPLEFPCHMLLACSNKKANFHEFAKNRNSSLYFVPVWTAEELEKFLVDFAPHTSVYGHMSVPDKGTVMNSFRLFGGVPRCVFHPAKSDDEKRSLQTAIGKLDFDACKKLFDLSFADDDSDKLVHMKFMNDTYRDYQYDFASQYVLEMVWQQLESKSKLETVGYLEKLLRHKTTGAAFGSMFELVAHALMAGGGKFPMKKVFKDRKPEAVGDLELEESNKKVFKELSDLLKFKEGDYCQPKKKNLPSVDAVILPDILLQFFHYTQGNYGFKIKGLQDLDDVLKKPRYRLCSCVPEDTYDSTGFQNYLGSKHIEVTRGSKELQGKIDQYVVLVDFRRYRFLEDPSVRSPA